MSQAPSETLSRRQVIQTSLAVLLGLGLVQTGAPGSSALAAAVVGSTLKVGDEKTTASGLKYKVLKRGTGTQVARPGDLVGIRFKGAYQDFVFDDTFATTEPFFIRLGSGNVIPGMEEGLKMMVLGDRLLLTVPADLAFGSRGRPASAGKPRIPGGATLSIELELSEFPGQMEEIMEEFEDATAAL